MEIVDDNSSIELVDDHYRALTAEEAEARRFHADSFAASEPLRHSSIFDIFTMLAAGIPHCRKVPYTEKILLVGSCYIGDVHNLRCVEYRRHTQYA